jgi:hypothetical protein
MDFSGKHLHKMNQEESWMVTYCNGWIYFISKSDCLRIKRISENGLKTETLVQDDCISFKIYKDVLYFSNHNHNNSLFSYHLKNKELNWIHPDSCWNFLIYQDQIFYMNATDNCHLYTMKTDGTNHRLLDNSMVWFPLVINQWLYFSNWSEGKRLFRISLDGKIKEPINQQASLKLSAVFTP